MTDRPSLLAEFENYQRARHEYDAHPDAVTLHAVVEAQTAFRARLAEVGVPEEVVSAAMRLLKQYREAVEAVFGDRRHVPTFPDDADVEVILVRLRSLLLPKEG